jgi:predicted RNase H-like HicB family nuclease
MIVTEAMKAKKYRVQFLNTGKWWVGWSDDVPGALTQGRTLEEARENLRDAIRLMIEPVKQSSAAAAPPKIVEETLSV